MTTNDRLQRHQQAYRGYLITRNIHSGEWYVSKGGYHISTSLTFEAACKVIDLLVG